MSSPQTGASSKRASPVEPSPVDDPSRERPEEPQDERHGERHGERHNGRGGPSRARWFPALLLLFGGALGLAVALKSIAGRSPTPAPGASASRSALPAELQDLITLALSIVIEALPFVVLGAVVSTAIRLYGPTGWLISHLPRWGPLRRLSISLFGTFMPVCECGNVPVARGLMVRGFTVGESSTFLLAAPIINPITFLATTQAFRLDPSVVWIRMAGAILIANLVGALISLHRKQADLLTGDFHATVCDLDDHHHHGDHERDPPSKGGRWRQGVELFRDETALMLKVLCLGAAIAGITQVFIPREVLTSVGSHPFYSILAMIALAFVISICANVDAFFALAYASTFTAGSIVAFLVFGPMVDIKMLTMMRTTYTTRFLVVVTAIVTVCSILIGLAVNLAY